MSDWNNENKDSAFGDESQTDNGSAFGVTDPVEDAQTDTEQAVEEPQEDENVSDEAQVDDSDSEAADGDSDADTNDADEEDAVEVPEDEIEGEEDNWVTDELIQDVSRFTVKFISADKLKRDFFREIIKPRRGQRAKSNERLGVSEIVSGLVFGAKTVNLSVLYLLNDLSEALNPETQTFSSGMAAIETIQATDTDDLRDLIIFINEGVLDGDVIKTGDVSDEDKVEKLRTGKTGTPPAQVIDSLTKAIGKIEDVPGFFALVKWSTDLTGALVE